MARRLKVLEQLKPAENRAFPCFCSGCSCNIANFGLRVFLTLRVPGDAGTAGTLEQRRCVETGCAKCATSAPASQVTPIARTKSARAGCLGGRSIDGPSLMYGDHRLIDGPRTRTRARARPLPCANPSGGRSPETSRRRYGLTTAHHSAPALISDQRVRAMKWLFSGDIHALGRTCLTGYLTASAETPQSCQDRP